MSFILFSVKNGFFKSNEMFAFSITTKVIAFCLSTSFSHMLNILGALSTSFGQFFFTVQGTGTTNGYYIVLQFPNTQPEAFFFF